MFKHVLYMLIGLAGLLSSQYMKAQGPIHWSWTAHKVSDKEYEVRLTATIEKGWHLYSQKQPEDAIALPTEILFSKNPLIELKDKVKENGALKKYRDKTLDVEAWQYSEKVVFVQKVKLKAKVKTNLSGTVEFQACTDEKCLLPRKVNFSIVIQ